MSILPLPAARSLGWRPRPAYAPESLVTLLSRNGADISRTFAEITAALPAAAVHRRLMLDGEIVALDSAGVPSFSRLQAARAAASAPQSCPPCGRSQSGARYSMS